MWSVYRQGEREHAFRCDADGGRIPGVVARVLPAEVATVCPTAPPARRR
jgi:hypothetical protein